MLNLYEITWARYKKRADEDKKVQMSALWLINTKFH